MGHLYPRTRRSRQLLGLEAAHQREQESRFRKNRWNEYCYQIVAIPLYDSNERQQLEKYNSTTFAYYLTIQYFVYQAFLLSEVIDFTPQPALLSLTN